MSDWKEYKLGDAPITIIDGDRGSNYPKHSEFAESGYCLFLSTRNVRENGFLFSECQFISEEKDKVLRNGKLQRQDIVLTTRGTIGNIGYYSDAIKYENIRINSGMIIIRPDTKYISPKFCFYLFRTLQKNFTSHVSGSAQPQLPIKDLKEIEIALPPLLEQERIAGILSSLDDKIDLLNRQNTTLEALAETLFRQWFIENLKEEWKEGCLGDLIMETVGGEWGKEIVENNYTQAVQCIRGTDIADLNVGLASKTPIRFIKGDKFDKIQPLKGDLILEISGGTENQSTGRVTYINEDVKALFSHPLIFSNFCRLLRIKNADYSYFLYCYLRHLYNQNEFFNLENGSSGIKNLDYKALLFDLKYIMPNNDNEIINFGKTARPYFEKINKNKLQIQNLTKLRNALLSKIMNYEIKI